MVLVKRSVSDVAGAKKRKWQLGSLAGGERRVFSNQKTVADKEEKSVDREGKNNNVRKSCEVYLEYVKKRALQKKN